MNCIEYDLKLIRGYLEAQHAPVSEVTLLKSISGLSTLPNDRDELFVLHFSLFHALYRLKFIAGASGLYLHIDPMRIRLVQVVNDGCCSFYFPTIGVFCGRESREVPYCIDHHNAGGRIEKPVSYDSMQEFYLNQENIQFCKTELFNKLLRGITVYAFRKGEIQKALAFFGLTNPDKKTIQRRYRELAKKMHPDRSVSDDSQMKLLNSSYQILCEVFVL